MVLALVENVLKEAVALAVESRSDAAQILESILETRGEVCMAYLTSLRDSGFWVGKLWPETEVELARLYLSQGDTVSATAALARAIEIWRHADDDFVPAAEARGLYLSIEGAAADGKTFIIQ